MDRNIADLKYIFLSFINLGHNVHMNIKRRAVPLRIETISFRISRGDFVLCIKISEPIKVMTFRNSHIIKET